MTLQNGSSFVTPSVTSANLLGHFLFTPLSNLEEFIGLRNFCIWSNFKWHIHISGNAGAAGASVGLIPLGDVNTLVVTADSSGNYSITGLNNGTYWLQPGLGGYVFSPFQEVVVSGANVTGINFTATAFSSTGVWTKNGGRIITQVNNKGNQPGTVIYEGGSQLGLGAGNVFKTWYMDGPSIYYAEALVAGGPWTVKVGAIVANLQWVTVFKILRHLLFVLFAARLWKRFSLYRNGWCDFLARFK